jgi:hypothetical protein
VRSCRGNREASWILSNITRVDGNLGRYTEEPEHFLKFQAFDMGRDPRSVETVHSIIKDVPSYRKPWVELMFNFWRVNAHSELGDGAEVLWLIFGEEIVLRQAESRQEIPTDPVMDDILLFLTEIAIHDQTNLGIGSRSPSSDSSTSASSVIPSSSIRQDTRVSRKGGEHTLPSVMSILTTFTTGNSSRSQSQNRRVSEEDASESIQDPGDTHRPIFSTKHLYEICRSNTCPHSGFQSARIYASSSEGVRLLSVGSNIPGVIANSLFLDMPKGSLDLPEVSDASPSGPRPQSILRSLRL